MRYSDRIAYVNHDIDDAIRSGLLRSEELPTECVKVLGDSHGARIERVIGDIVANSIDESAITMSDEILEALTELRSFLNTNVYRSELAARDEQKADGLLAALYNRFVDDPTLIPDTYSSRCGQDGHTRCVVDYIAGMTDKYAINVFSELFIPKVNQIDF